MTPAPKQNLVEYYNSAVTSSFFNAGKTLDIDEQNNVLAAVKALIENRADDEDLDLSKLLVSKVHGSTFDQAYEPAQIALQKLTEKRAFLLLDDRYIFSRTTVFQIDTNGRLRGLDDDFWLDLDKASGLIEPADRDWFDTSNDSLVTTYLRDDLHMLAECAANLGGYVFTGEFISVGQWLQFHRYDLPATVMKARQLIAQFSFKLPSSPPLGNYHGLIFPQKNSAFRLTDADREAIIGLIKETTRGAMTLLQHLIPHKNFSVNAAAARRQHAGIFLEQLLRSPKSLSFGTQLHARLNWHLEGGESDGARLHIMQLVVAALIIDLVPNSEKHDAIVAGFDLYDPDYVYLNPTDVVEKLEQHLLKHTIVDVHSVQLAAHLLLSGTAPEFLINDTPAELTLGKPGWVVISQAVAAIELAAPGTSRLMNYAEIKAFAELDPTSHEQYELQEITSALPVINWAVMNNLVTYSPQKDYSHETVIEAAIYFQRYVEALHLSEKDLSTAAPDRSKLLLETLSKVLVPGEYLEHKAFIIKYEEAVNERNWMEMVASLTLGGQVIETVDRLSDRQDWSGVSVSAVRRLRLSILDLYMSGDLIENGELTKRFRAVKNFSAPKGAFQRLKELEPAALIFDRAFNKYYEELQAGLTSLIKFAICGLPSRHRHSLTNGYVSIYTVRETANPINAFEETQNHRDAKKGRFGVILCTQSAGKTHCYELFTLRGLCRERPELADMLRATGTIRQNSELSYTGKKSDFRKKTPDHVWPLDFNAYATGAEPENDVTSTVVVEKLWQGHLQANDVGQVALFFSPALEKLADLLLTYHPVLTREAMYASLNQPSALEQIRQHNTAVDTFLVDLIVPFKKCIEDIQSGDAPRVSEGIGGCILDGLAIVGLLIGLGTTVASIVAKTASTTAKAFSIAKATLRFAAAVVNPLDSVPDLAKNGARLIKRGALVLSQRSSHALETASRQIHRLTGRAQSYDVVKLADRSDIAHGTFRPLDTPDLVSSWAVRGVDNWYALNPLTRSPWGPPLRPLKIDRDFIRVPGLHRLLPKSYARTLINNALPIASRKIDLAISALKRTNDIDRQLIFKAFFGSASDDVIEAYLDGLKIMREDLEIIEMSNIHLDTTKASSAMAGLYPQRYRAWQAATRSDQLHEQFIVIFTDPLNNFYRQKKYDDSRIADVLLHEMSHGGPATKDFFYADHGRRISQAKNDTEVSGLLNLALGREHVDHTSRLAGEDIGMLVHPPSADNFQFIDDAPGLLNADSHATVTSLLSQSVTNPTAYQANLTALASATKPGQGRVDTAVWLSLGQGSRSQA
ncbi:hypothetical protein PS718_03394 [Pseudomonas fluorescens]|uniref:Uncharacterized protein n=1 Tax=Pseudomonas fluorescens TaxID=294 RepID=A0A5E7DF37_PSEFL|nr:hypothetical protein [Pseudomonas fluorescens]VVO10535.1 hypothetical protein PS718_03394 [Pseudomonas fluorescens]